MATLTKAMLNDLNKGCASVRIISIPTSPSSIADYKFADADELFTKDGSLSISQDELSQTDYKLDQFKEIFDTDFETGSFTVKGFIPCTANAVMDYFFAKGDSVGGDLNIYNATTADYTAAAGYDAKVNTLDRALCIVSESKETGIIFTKARMAAVLGEQDRYRGVSFNGTILPSGKTGIGTFYPFKPKA